MMVELSLIEFVFFFSPNSENPNLEKEMSLRRSRSETEIINRRTDKDSVVGAARLGMKPKSGMVADKTFEDVLDRGSDSLFSTPVPNKPPPAEVNGFKFEMEETTSPCQDKDSVFGGCHGEMKPESGMVDVLARLGNRYSSLVSTPVPYKPPPAEEIGFKFKMEETTPPGQALLAEVNGFKFYEKITSPCQDKDSVFGGCHREMKPESGMVDFLARLGNRYSSSVSMPVPYKPPPAEEIGFKFKMEETTSPGQASWTGPHAEPKDETVKSQGCVTRFHLPVKTYWGPDPCAICGNFGHDELICGLRQLCPIDQKVGEGYKIACLCGNDRTDGKCPYGCHYRFGRVVGYKSSKYFFNPARPVSELFSTSSPKCN